MEDNALTSYYRSGKKSSLASMNDAGLSFEQIADLIEEMISERKENEPS